MVATEQAVRAEILALEGVFRTPTQMFRKKFSRTGLDHLVFGVGVGVHSGLSFGPLFYSRLVGLDYDKTDSRWRLVKIELPHNFRWNYAVVVETAQHI